MIETLLARRDRWLADRTVRDRVARWPLGRSIARRHAHRLFALVSGFAHSQMLAAALDLGLFDRLAGGPLPVGEVAQLIDLPPRGFDALIQAMLALQLVEMRPRGRLALAVDGLVLASDPGIRAMIAHHALLYADLGDPVALLRSPGRGRLGALWPYAGGCGKAADYSALMATSQTLVADAICAAYDFGRHRWLVDVGGGDGSFLATIADRWPQLRLGLIELPPVATLARESFDARGLRTIEVHAGSEDMPIPRGADAMTLVRVLHDRDDGAASALLARVGAALPVGGTVIVAEPMARSGRDLQRAYFAAYFAAMGSGRLRTAKQVAALLRASGFKPSRPKPDPAGTLTLLAARKA